MLDDTLRPAVDFREYRTYETTRQDANNAMMALLAGSELAVHTLQLTAGSQQLLPDIFPGIEHIQYFRLRTDVATRLLLDTGHHLGAAAVPYALAVHEAFVMAVFDILDQLGYTRLAPGDRSAALNRVAAWNMHEALYLTLSAQIPVTGSAASSWLEQFHLLREMRNSHIHNGGDLSRAPRLHERVALTSTATAKDWERLARRPTSDVITGTNLRFTIFDVFTVFAVTKGMGRLVNDLLQRTLSTPQWARLCVEDYAAISTKAPRSDRWMRSLRGFADAAYKSVELADSDLIDAAVAAGYWTSGRAVTPRRSARSAKRGRNIGTQFPNVDN